MIPHTAYTAISLANHEADLARPPLREHHHAFGEPTCPPQNRPHRRGTPGLLTRLAARITAILSGQPATEKPLSRDWRVPSGCGGA